MNTCVHRFATLVALSASLALGLVAPEAHAAPATPPRSCGEVLLPMSDGVRLYGWVNHQTPMARRPVLLTISSYTNAHCPGGSSYLMSSAVANRFSMVFVNMRGSGSSEGEYDLFGSKTQSDIHAVVQWAATQPWSNGKILVTGSSGNGLFIFDALKEPAVKAAIPMTSCPDLYRCFHHGGATGLQVVGVYATNMLEGYADGLTPRKKYGLDANPSPAQQLATLAATAGTVVQHPLYDSFWAQRSLLGQLAKIDKPILWTSSNFDLLDVFDGLPLARNFYLNMGMSHSVWWDFTPLSQAPAPYKDVILGQVERFANHFMFKGRSPRPARVALMTANGGFRSWYKQQAYLRKETAWPLPSTVWTNLHLGGTVSPDIGSLNNGSLDSEAGSGADTVPLLSSPGIGQDLRTLMLVPVLGRSSAGADVIDATSPLWDLRREEAAGLTYTTPLLRQDLEVTGPIVARIWARTLSTDFTWAVRIADVAPDGTSQWITDGYLRAGLRAYDDARSQRSMDGHLIRVRREFDRTDPVPINTPVEYVIQITDSSSIFRAGHRLRFDIEPLAGDGYGLTDTPGVGVLTVLHDAAHPSSLQLPVIPGRCRAGIA